MISFLKRRKINKELKSFKAFKSNFKFEYKDIVEKDGDLYCCDELVKKKDDREISRCCKWLNVGFNLQDPFSKALSNLFPYRFWFRGKIVSSIESVLQGIKYKDKKIQNMVFEYYGMPSNVLKVCSDYDWRESGTLYWQGRELKRNSTIYDDFIDELFVSALQNPFYRNALKNVDTPYILHSLGGDDKSKTVLTRFEFEYMLNCLKSFVRK